MDAKKPDRWLGRDIYWFAFSIVKHWEGKVGAFLACSAVALAQAEGFVIPLWCIGVIGGGCLITAIFHAWRDERAAKEKAQSDLEAKIHELAAVPNIAGHWVRQIYGVPGVLSLTLDGHKFGGTFKEGNCDHVIEGTYDQAKKQFDVRTERIDLANPSAGRFVQSETYWLVGNDRIYFENPKNVNGVFESGFLKRKDT